MSFYRLLVNHLTSSDPKVVSVAAHDLGEYLKYYPQGKQYVVFKLTTVEYWKKWTQREG